MIVHTRANLTTPTTVLREQYDILSSQCRHIEHMHEGVWFSTKLAVLLFYNLWDQRHLVVKMYHYISLALRF